jgi:2-methylcitrate dehydratase PrpD
MIFDDIAAFALDPLDIPENALDAAATLLIDTLGVAAGAAPMESGRIARDHAVRFQSAPNDADAAPLLFDGRMASLTGAAFALASQIDNLDAHDGLNETKGHIGCAVVPALCALAHAKPDLTGREALTAMVMAYEVSARAAVALHTSVSDYHTSGAWNGLGVAALGCRLKGLPPDMLRHALGIAEYHGPRSQMMREIANPTMLHDGSGMGAMVGMMAVLLAEEGFTGAPAVTAEDAPDIWADLGQRWTVAENYIKPYPICRWAHAALDATGGLMDAQGLNAADIESVHVNTFAEAAELYPGLPATTSQAQYSLRFALAARIAKGRVGPDDIAEAGLFDPDVAAVLERITISEHSRHSTRFPAGRWSDVTLTLKDGRTLSSGDVHARGGPEAPMDLAEVEAKFHLMAQTLPDPRRAAIWSMRERLQHTDSRFTELLSLLADPPETPFD